MWIDVVSTRIADRTFIINAQDVPFAVAQTHTDMGIDRRNRIVQQVAAMASVHSPGQA